MRKEKQQKEMGKKGIGVYVNERRNRNELGK